MSWFRVDDKSAWHKKVVNAGNAAWGALMRMGAHCSDQLTDGFVVTGVARAIASDEEIDRLLDVGLLERAEGGFTIHDYLDWNPSSKEVSKLKRERAKSGRAGAAKRWQGDSERHGKRDGNSEANAKQEGWQKHGPYPSPYQEETPCSPPETTEQPASASPPPPAPPPAPEAGPPAWTRDPFGLDGLGAAWASGASEGLKSRVTKPSRGEVQRIVAVVEAHAPPAAQSSWAQAARLAWVRDSAAAWGRTAPRKVSVFSWVDWANGRASEANSPVPEPVAEIPAVPIPPPMTDAEVGARNAAGWDLLAVLDDLAAKTAPLTAPKGLGKPEDDPGADVRWTRKRVEGGS